MAVENKKLIERWHGLIPRVSTTCWQIERLHRNGQIPDFALDAALHGLKAAQDDIQHAIECEDAVTESDFLYRVECLEGMLGPHVNLD